MQRFKNYRFDYEAWHVGDEKDKEDHGQHQKESLDQNFLILLP